jgi:hypothetical protein
MPHRHGGPLTAMQQQQEGLARRCPTRHQEGALLHPPRPSSSSSRGSSRCRSTPTCSSLPRSATACHRQQQQDTLVAAPTARLLPAPMVVPRLVTGTQRGHMVPPRHNLAHTACPMARQPLHPTACP